MEKLKSKLFSVLAEDIKVLDFEQWLYANEELLGIIDKDPFVFEVYNLNYKSDRILKTIDNICKEIDGEEGYIISIVERECRKILETENEETILDRLYKIREYHSFENYELLFEFYLLNINMDMSIEGYGPKIDHIEEAHLFARKVLGKLKSKSLNEKKNLLINGFPKKENIQVVQKNQERKRSASVKSEKPWYQFWK